MKNFFTLVVFFFPFVALSQYSKYIEAKVSSIDNEAFGIVKLSRSDNHVKVKYFSAKDYDGTSVYQRYLNWSVNKKVIAFSSGTYMDRCEDAEYATPIGLCIDQGRSVNKELVKDKLDAMAIVYATGGMATSNLADGNLKITYPNGTSKTLNIRNDAYDKAEFMEWAKTQEATVFQTHLLVYNGVNKLGINSSPVKQERRFLAACIGSKGDVVHYIINLPTASTLYNGVTKAMKILNKMEEVKQIVFMINLDTGCQNVFSAFDSNNKLYTNALLRGQEDVSKSINLLAYYYE